MQVDIVTAHLYTCLRCSAWQIVVCGREGFSDAFWEFFSLRMKTCCTSPVLNYEFAIFLAVTAVCPLWPQEFERATGLVGVEGCCLQTTAVSFLLRVVLYRVSFNKGDASV